MASETIGHVWFTGRKVIGIIVVHNEHTSEPKAFISSVIGQDETYDMEQIKDWGTKFPVEEAISLIEKHGTISNKEVWDKIKAVPESKG